MSFEKFEDVRFAFALQGVCTEAPAPTRKDLEADQDGEEGFECYWEKDTSYAGFGYTHSTRMFWACLDARPTGRCFDIDGLVDLDGHFIPGQGNGLDQNLRWFFDVIKKNFA